MFSFWFIAVQLCSHFSYMDPIFRAHPFMVHSAQWEETQDIHLTPPFVLRSIALWPQVSSLLVSTSNWCLAQFAAFCSMDQNKWLFFFFFFFSRNCSTLAKEFLSWFLNKYPPQSLSNQPSPSKITSPSFTRTCIQYPDGDFGDERDVCLLVIQKLHNARRLLTKHLVTSKYGRNGKQGWILPIAGTPDITRDWKMSPETTFTKRWVAFSFFKFQF